MTQKISKRKLICFSEYIINFGDIRACRVIKCDNIIVYICNHSFSRICHITTTYNGIRICIFIQKGSTEFVPIFGYYCVYLQIILKKIAVLDPN